MGYSGQVGFGNVRSEGFHTDAWAAGIPRGGPAGAPPVGPVRGTHGHRRDSGRITHGEWAEDTKNRNEM